MVSRRIFRFALASLTVLLVLGLAAPVLASPAPVSGCPPCSEGFSRAAASHGLDTEVEHGAATVQVHRNGSATWSVRVVPTNQSILPLLAENQTLARSVATSSFGTRYGGGIEHELISVNVTDGAFHIRYRTLEVVREGPFGAQVLTYFRDSPGAWVYTDLGADEVTIVAPSGMTVARGFGEVTGDRLTASELPDVRNGPFVVFVSEGSTVPGLRGWLAVLGSIWSVVLRNLIYFVAIPGGVLIGGFAGIRRYLSPTTYRNPTHLGSLVAAAGAALLAGTFVWEGEVLPVVTGNALLGGVGGILLFASGASVGVSGIRRYLTGKRLVGIGLVVGIGAYFTANRLLGAGGIHQPLALAAALPPIAVGLGWLDAQPADEGGISSSEVSLGLAVAIVGVLIVTAPLNALGGSLFLLVPILLTVAAIGIVVVAVPLYLLGGAGAHAELVRFEEIET